MWIPDDGEKQPRQRGHYNPAAQRKKTQELHKATPAIELLPTEQPVAGKGGKGDKRIKSKIEAQALEYNKEVN